MKAKHWLLILVPLVVVVLNACTSVSTVVQDIDPLDGEAALQLENPEIEGTPTEVNRDAEGEEVQGEGVKEDEPTPLPSPGSTHSLEPGERPSCEDPFEGTNIRFSSRGWETDFCQHSVPYDEFLSGGPPRDGIPPIDAPKFETLESADAWLEDREPVIALALKGEARAYPLQILIWHEIVNDTLDDHPIVVTFCPLCNTALVFTRPIIAGELLTFGTSGNLRNSDLVMWDRQTESWWQQFSGEAIVGELTGTQLEFLPTAILSWGDFKAKYPQSQVLSKDTGSLRNYGANPYTGYDDVDQSPFLFDGELDDRLPPMTRVVGLEIGSQAAAYVYDRLFDEQVIHDTLGGEALVVFWKAGTASAVDTGSIAEGRDVGTTGVFLRTVGDQVLTFKPGAEGSFIDEETGSTWDILGEAIAGPLAGTVLTPLPHHDTFWFAWAAFVPDGTLGE